MEFNALGKNKPAKLAKKDVPINLAIRLERIEISSDGSKPSIFHGFDVNTNEPVQVRMMTVEEGAAVNRRKEETQEAVIARLDGQYRGDGEKHRPRAGEINNPQHKTYCAPGGLLMFNKALKNEDGSFRAHWVETLEREAGAGCDKVIANVRIDNYEHEGKKTTHVAADVINLDTAELITKDNAVSVLSSMFANTSPDGKEKFKPFIFVRLQDAQSGKIVLPPARASAKYLETTKTDADTGSTFKVREVAPAVDSIINLNAPENVTQDALVIRAALFGLGDEPGYPKYEGVSEQAVLDDLKQITDGVRDGFLKVEVIGGHRLSAGPATRASIIKSAQSNALNPLNTVYTKRNDKGWVTERRFAETFLTTKIGQDGYRYFAKALPAELSPKALPVMKLATKNDLAANASEAAQERVAKGAANDLPESVGDIVQQPLDSVQSDDVDAQLEKSASALELM